jgi:hypothetical protein
MTRHRVDHRALPLTSLRVNENNDRHGEQGSELLAIRWLLENRTVHMRNLARDIVQSGGLYEPPLVIPRDGAFLVEDGNRRVTCLKLLADHTLAPSFELEGFFRELRQEWVGPFSEQIVCRIETDPDEIDEILYRRHTGSQNGVGQSPWDDRAKLNFVARTGKHTRIDVASEISKLLTEAGHEDEARRLPRSNLNRLLSAETFRNRIGISTKGGKFELTHAREAVVRASFRIARDLIERRVVLGDLWDNERKRHYLAGLEEDAVLPTHADLIGSKPDRSRQSGGASTTKTVPPAGQVYTSASPTLIPRDLGCPVKWTSATARHRAIWDELQNKLLLAEHPNAIGVLFRVLLELAIDHYGSVHRVGFFENDKLARRLEKVADHMVDSGQIDQKHRLELKKFGQSEQLVSAHTMNSYVHSPRFSPSPEHLRAMWTSLSGFVALCLDTQEQPILA